MAPVGRQGVVLPPGRLASELRPPRSPDATRHPTSPLASSSISKKTSPYFQYFVPKSFKSCLALALILFVIPTRGEAQARGEDFFSIFLAARKREGTFQKFSFTTQPGPRGSLPRLSTYPSGIASNKHRRPTCSPAGPDTRQNCAVRATDGFFLHTKHVGSNLVLLVAPGLRCTRRRHCRHRGEI